jgi:hypothetical protein
MKGFIIIHRQSRRCESFLGFDTSHGNMKGPIAVLRQPTVHSKFRTVASGDVES